MQQSVCAQCHPGKSQGQQRARGESRALQPRAQSVARILQGLFDQRHGSLVAMQFFCLLDAGSVSEGALELREKASYGSPLFFGSFPPYGALWPVQCMTPRKAVQGPTASRYW